MNSLTVDTLITGQKKENNKISGNYYLTVLVYMVNDEIQYYLIIGLISGDKIKSSINLVNGDNI